MIKVKYTEKGDIDFNDLIKRLKNPRPLLSEVGDLIREDIQTRIKKTKVDPQGNAWAPWAESTYIARAKEGSAGLGLLYRTGRLYNSLLKDVHSRDVKVYSTAPYARFLNNGTSNMPAREFIGVSAKANADIDKLVRSYMGIK